MANLLTITKIDSLFFSFVVNGDTANTILNERNGLTIVGVNAHFKTANGANLIKEQNISYANITIIDGATTLISTSQIDLINKLTSVGFFDWIGSGGNGGVTRFDALDDTFDYFGQDGKVPIVDESQLKLIPFELPDVSKLNDFPDTLTALKILRVNSAATAYELVDISSFITGFKVEQIDYPRLTEVKSDFIIPSGKIAIGAMVNFTPCAKLTENNVGDFRTFSQIGTTVTFQTPLSINEYVTIFYQ